MLFLRSENCLKKLKKFIKKKMNFNIYLHSECTQIRFYSFHLRCAFFSKISFSVRKNCPIFYSVSYISYKNHYPNDRYFVNIFMITFSILCFFPPDFWVTLVISEKPLLILSYKLNKFHSESPFDCKNCFYCCSYGIYRWPPIRNFG